MGNMTHYDNLKAVPLTALKEIGFGKLKGKSDINPQWRYEAMTSEFGTCGIGWKYEIVKTWTQEANDGQLMLFVEVNLYIFDYELAQWGQAIPAIGGDFLLEKDKNGLHGNDEAYKMATTDALGVAMKMLGVAADVYRGLANDSKYGRDKPNEPIRSNTPKPTQSNSCIIRKETQHAIGSEAKQRGISANTMTETIKEKYKKNSSGELTEDEAQDLLKFVKTIEPEVKA